MYNKLLKLFKKSNLPIYIVETDYDDLVNTDCVVGKDWDAKDQPIFRVQYGKNSIEEMTESFYVENFLYPIRGMNRNTFYPSKTKEETHERDWVLFETLQRYFKINEPFTMPNAFLGIEYMFPKWPATKPVALVYYPCVGSLEEKHKHYMAISSRHRKYGRCPLVDMDWLHLSEKATKIKSMVEFKNTKYVRIRKDIDQLNQEPLMQLAQMIGASFAKILYTKGKYNDFKVLIGDFDFLADFLKNNLTKLKK